MPDINRMRVMAFHVDGERGFGAGERRLLDLAAVLGERGYGNMIVCREGDELEREAKRLGFDTLGLPFLFDWDPVTAYLLKTASDVHGAIVHAHTDQAAGIAGLARHLGGAPWVAGDCIDLTAGAAEMGEAAARTYRRVLAPSYETAGNRS